MVESTQMPNQDPVEETVSEPDEKVKQWASEWADKFDQTVHSEHLEAFLGKSVSGKADTPEGPRGFSNAVVTGWSVDTVAFQPDMERPDDWEYAYRYSILTADGKQLALLSGMVLSVDE